MKFAKYSVMMLSFSGAYMCASDCMEARFTLSLENTEEGYRYQIKSDRGVLLVSEPSLTTILERYKPTREQLAHVVPQQDNLIDRLKNTAVEAQDVARQALKQLVESHKLNEGFALVTRRQILQLKLQTLTISALTLLNAGLVGYYWYQQWYGVPQNCPLQ